MQASVDEAAAELEELAVRCERLAREQSAAGERRKEAIAAVAVGAGVPKREVFDAVVAAKNEGGGTAP